MEKQIQLLQPPTIVDIGEWVCCNIGKVAAGQRIPNSSKVKLLAIEKADIASEQMILYAKENQAMILTSISEGETNAID